MTEHVLKTLAPYFDAVADGSKTFELRKNDRGYKVGDVLVLQRWAEPGPLQDRDAAPLRKRVSYVLLGGQYGLDREFCVLGLGETTP